jgi:hypothetical protein
VIGGRLFITIHGTVADNEAILFRAYEQTTGRMLDISETITFQGQCLGELDSPMLLHAQTGTTSISGLADMSGVCAVYAADGKRLDRPQRGVNIVVMTDGTTQKVIVE